AGPGRGRPVREGSPARRRAGQRRRPADQRPQGCGGRTSAGADDSQGDPLPGGRAPAPAGQHHHPPVQGGGPPGAGAGRGLRLRGRGLRLPQRRGPGHYRLALQRLPLLQPYQPRSSPMTKTQTIKPRASVQLVRCAVYTRKSTEEGLEQEFNSLDAQREAGEAFVQSQQHEGWTCLPERYDDGGFTGGNMERPALRRLMADIEAGRVDGVVVYKVDRLSRSLLDFARMMATFDKYRVSFVSVTQQFNTATSMGRLVLNVLLSFAQFEREIISERTR